MNVYFLEAKGISAFVGEATDRVRSSTAFTTRERAEGLVEDFKTKCVESGRLSSRFPIHVRVIELEVVD